MRNLKSRHLEMLVVIVEQNKASKVLHLADEKGVTASVAMLGIGTASRTLFDYLGLNDKKKAVLLLFVIMVSSLSFAAPTIICVV